VFLQSAGLIQIAASVGLTLLAPRKKISVLLIGNHSAGKSSFINWCVGNCLLLNQLIGFY
jgi:predicted GTPase